MISTYFSITIVTEVFLLFWPVILVPELLKKLRETPGNNFHQVSFKSEPGCPSYDPQNQTSDLKKQSRFVFVMFCQFLVITRSQELGFARNLMEIDPRSLPDLFKQLRDQNNRQKQSKTSDKIFLGSGVGTCRI